MWCQVWSRQPWRAFNAVSFIWEVMVQYTFSSTSPFFSCTQAWCCCKNWLLRTLAYIVFSFFRAGDHIICWEVHAWRWFLWHSLQYCNTGINILCVSRASFPEKTLVVFILSSVCLILAGSCFPRLAGCWLFTLFLVSSTLTWLLAVCWFGDFDTPLAFQ